MSWDKTECLKAYLYSQTWVFPSWATKTKNKNKVNKNRKMFLDIFTIPFACHVLFDWPFIFRFQSVANMVRKNTFFGIFLFYSGTFLKKMCVICAFRITLITLMIKCVWFWLKFTNKINSFFATYCQKRPHYDGILGSISPT